MCLQGIRVNELHRRLVDSSSVTSVGIFPQNSEFRSCNSVPPPLRILVFTSLKSDFFSQNFEFTSRNSYFILYFYIILQKSHNCIYFFLQDSEFTSCNSDFFFQDSEFTSCNSDFSRMLSLHLANLIFFFTEFYRNCILLNCFSRILSLHLAILNFLSQNCEFTSPNSELIFSDL